MKRTRTFEVTYNYFDVGATVTPTSTRSPLEIGRHYIVTKCYEPKYAGDDCIVFVEGVDYGISTEYLEEV